MMQARNRKLFYSFLFPAVLLVGLALRLRGLDTTGLWGDQAFTLNTAMRWVNGGALPLAANKSSVGFVNPPMIEYLYAAALWLWPDILSVSWLTLLGGLLAVTVTGYVTARLFGRRAGIWAMLAFAVAPWAVFWSQLIWNQTMVPPFATLALGGLLLYLANRPRAVYLVVAFAAAAAMTQVHPGSAVQLVTIALALLIFRRRVRWSHVLAGVVIFALLYLPYLFYQIGTGWADFRAIGGLAGQETMISSAAALLSLDLVHAQGLYRAVARAGAFDHLATALYLAALAVVGWRLWRNRRAGESKHEVEQAGTPAGDPGSETIALIVILLWLFVPLLFYLRSSVYLQNYYLVGQWPAHFMILGIGLDTAQSAAKRLASRSGSAGRQRIWTAVAWLLPLPFVALVIFQVHFTLRYQDARAAGDGPQFQVRHAREMIDTSSRLLDERPECRLVGLGHGHQVENSDLALLQEFVDPQRVILADGDLALPQPSPCAVYLDAWPGSLASYSLSAEATPIPDAIVAVDDRAWQFYDWVQPQRAGSYSPISSWGMGLDLIGYFPGELIPGREMTLALTWEIKAAAPEDTYHFGAYLLNEAGDLVAQQDGPGFDSVQWRAGDRFVTFHRLSIPNDLPAGSYRTAVALYTWPDLIRADLARGGNTAFLEQIDFPPPSE